MRGSTPTKFMVNWRGSRSTAHLLDRFAERVRGRGWVCDLGCGPAQIARYLRDRGVDAFGVDLSAGMLAQAQRLNPDLQFVQTSMLTLGLRSEQIRRRGRVLLDHSYPAIKSCVKHWPKFAEYCSRAACFCSLFIWAAKTAITRNCSGGRVSLDIALFTTDEMCGYLKTADFSVEQVLERDPYSPEVEYQSRRGYILALRPLG